MLVRNQTCAAKDGESKDGQHRRAPVKVESGKSLAAPAVAVALRVEHGVMPFPSVCVFPLPPSGLPRGARKVGNIINNRRRARSQGVMV
jgi:hypothetical protein